MTPAHVLCFAEDPDLALELLGVARAAATGAEDRVSLIGIPGDRSPPGRLSAAGAHQVYRISSPQFRLDSPESLAQGIARVVESTRPTLVLFSSTKRGREIAARLAGLVDGAAVTGVSKVTIDPEGVRITREMLSGSAVGEERLSGPLPIVAMAPGAAYPAPASVGAAPETDVPVELAEPVTSILERLVKPAGGLRIEAAERIVSVGRGLQKKEDLALIEELARAFGAVLGCTRPVAAEAGWLGDDHWIGLTGHRVKPRLYVAVGISGAVQHIVGMRDSHVVVAINKDPNAPIFVHADYRLVGDLYALVPALVKALGESPT